MKRYEVYVRDTKGNVTLMSEHYDKNDALEEEAILSINNPYFHVWVESNTYWDDKDD